MINSNACCKTREQLLKRKRKKKKTNEPRNLKWNAKKYAIQKKVGKGNKTGGTIETHSKMERTAKAKIHHRNETAQRPWTRAGENAENRQVHRGSQDPRTPGLSPRKRTAIPPAWPGLAFLHGRPWTRGRGGEPPRLPPRVHRQPGPWKARNSEGAFVTTVYERPLEKL